MFVPTSLFDQDRADYTPKLYDLMVDPGEAKDIASTSEGQPIVKELMEALAEHAKTAGVAHDRDPIDPKSDPRLHGGNWVPWE